MVLFLSVFHLTSCSYIQPKEKASPMCDIIPRVAANW